VASAASLLNGDFQSNNGSGEINYNPGGGAYAVADWTVSGGASGSYDFVFNPNTSATSGSSADSTGAVQQGSSTPLTLWGPDGVGADFYSNNGFSVATLKADGGNGTFIAADPDYTPGNNNSNTSTISQTVTGLTSGQSYTVTFEYAGAEQTKGSGAGGEGPTTEGWGVSWNGGAEQYTGGVSTGNLSNSGGGFTGWDTGSFTFTATGTSDVLSFLAVGTGGNSLPPFALLSDVSVAAVPEPATWAMMLLGIGGLGASLRMRRQQQLAAA
jgi:hypothetical protein